MPCNLIINTVIPFIMMEENSKFVDFYDSLLPHEKKFFKAQIILACQISAVMFHHWTRGIMKIRNPYRVIINMIAGRQLFETIKISPLYHAENLEGV